MEPEENDLDDVEVVYLDGSGDEFIEDDQNEDMEDDYMQVPDISKLNLIKHSKSVFCCDLSKNDQLAATGGEDDCAYVWTTANGDVVLECTGHKDSVISVCFNHNSELLATGDMSGMIQVWDIKASKLIWCTEGDDLEWLTWHPSANILISGSQSGEIFITLVPDGKVKTLPSHGSSCTTGKFLDGKSLLAGYEDGHVKLWDIKSISTKWNFFDSQKLNVTSIEVNSDGNLCSIAPSGKLLKMSDGKSVATMLIKDENEIEVHKFSVDRKFLVTGSLTGQICVWELQKQTIHHKPKLQNGITTLELALQTKAFFGCTDGSIHMCDIQTGVFEKVFTGHLSNILSIKISHDGYFILSTGDDHTAKIFYIQDNDQSV